MFKISNIRSLQIFRRFVVIAIAIFSLSIQAQITAQEASVKIEGEVKTAISLTPSDIDKLEKTIIIAKDRKDQEHTYSGAELSVILKRAGVTLGEELKGENLTKYLLIEASDGYQVLFSLAETDPSFSQKKIILANRKDGALLSSDEAPFHIIIEGEKRKPRSIRQVISIKIKYAN